MSIQFSSNNSLSLEEIYHPNVAHICSYFDYFALSLANITTVIGCYIILTQSTAQMGQYKYIMLLQTIWSYVFDLAYVIIQPIFLLPHLFVYSGGLLKSVSPEVFFMSDVMVLMILFSGAHSVLFALTYRVAQLFYHSWVEEWFTGRKLWIVYIGSYIVFITPLAVGLYTMYLILWKMDIQTALHQLSIANPAITLLMQEEPSLIGVDAEYLVPFSLAFYTSIGAYAIIVITFLSFIYILYIFRYNKIKETLSMSTRKTIDMLFRVLNIQILLLIITFFIPFFGICALLVLKLNDISHITTILMTPLSFHYTLDFLCLIYFVPPFKLFVAKKLMKVKKVLLCQNSGQITVSTVTSINIQVQSQLHSHK